jgi:hypothetical protein
MESDVGWIVGKGGGSCIDSTIILSSLISVERVANDEERNS